MPRTLPSRTSWAERGLALGAVNPAAVDTDVCGQLLLGGCELAAKARRHGLLRQPLHLHLRVLALHLCDHEPAGDVTCQQVTSRHASRPCLKLTVSFGALSALPAWSGKVSAPMKGQMLKTTILIYIEGERPRMGSR